MLEHKKPHVSLLLSLLLRNILLIQVTKQKETSKSSMIAASHSPLLPPRKILLLKTPTVHQASYLQALLANDFLVQHGLALSLQLLQLPHTIKQHYTIIFRFRQTHGLAGTMLQSCIARRKQLG